MPGIEACSTACSATRFARARGMAIAVALAASALPIAPAPAADTQQAACTNEAKEQAEKLLRFHADQDDRASIPDEIRTLRPVRNPANSKQKLQVLQLWGHVYKGTYRIRLIYSQTPGDSCVLMGQEILEYARP